MKKIVIEGGRRLSGEVKVSGSKNAVLPIIFSCILINGVSEIENVPDIGDVYVALQILSFLGADIKTEGEKTFIDTKNLTYREPPSNLVQGIRASTYLLGSCLSKFGRCPIMHFGGCNFSHRPIDMHISAALSFGATLEDGVLVADKLHPAEISFKKASVGATVNAILLAAGIEGRSVLRGCAIEPHIDALIEFLNSAGASIVRNGREIIIDGSRLNNGKIKIIGDMIEAGSYLALGALCGDVSVTNAPIGDMTSIISAFSDMGTTIEKKTPCRLTPKVASPRKAKLIADPYPDFPTDLQPIFAPLMACLSGGEIIDNVWRDRFGYLSTLSAFGVEYRHQGNHALIMPSRIQSATVSAPDLRGGMAALICALVTNGRSVIYSADTILRGYEKLEEKLSAIGADIKIEDY